MAMDARSATASGVALHRQAAVEVRGERAVLGDHHAEVDRPPHAGGLGGRGEGLGGAPLAVLERRAVLRRLHGVHEVVGHLDPVHRLLEAGARQQVAADRRDGEGHPRGVPRERPDLVAGGQQRRDERRSREARGAGDEDAHPAP
jgi:hypothetical protein